MTTINFNDAYARRRRIRRGPRRNHNASFLTPKSIRAQRWLLADRISHDDQPVSLSTTVSTESKTS
jgi:hypothetical protein